MTKKDDLPDLGNILGAALNGLAPVIADEIVPITKRAAGRKPSAEKAHPSVAPKPPVSVLDLDEAGELSAADKAALDKEAELEVLADLKAKAMDDYKKAKKLELSKKAMFKHGKDAKGQNVERIAIDVAQHVPHIRLDGVVYYPGFSYTVSHDVARVLKEQMYRSYLHDAEINGLDINGYMGRQKALARLGPQQLN